MLSQLGLTKWAGPRPLLMGLWNGCPPLIGPTSPNTYVHFRWSFPKMLKLKTSSSYINITSTKMRNNWSNCCLKLFLWNHWLNIGLGFLFFFCSCFCYIREINTNNFVSSIFFICLYSCYVKGRFLLFKCQIVVWHTMEKRQLDRWHVVPIKLGERLYPMTN